MGRLRGAFDAIAALIVGGEDPSGMALSAIPIETMRTAFAPYAATTVKLGWSLPRSVVVTAASSLYNGHRYPPVAVSR